MKKLNSFLNAQLAEDDVASSSKIWQSYCSWQVGNWDFVLY